MHATLQPVLSADIAQTIQRPDLVKPSHSHREGTPVEKPEKPVKVPDAVPAPQPTPRPAKPMPAPRPALPDPATVPEKVKASAV